MPFSVENKHVTKMLPQTKNYMELNAQYRRFRISTDR